MQRADSRRLRGSTRDVDAVARALRRAMTPAEEVLWERLRSRRLDGWKFRAQHAVGRFIFDFYCPRARVVVEVDGGVHRSKRERDGERDELLRSAHYTVLRVDNEDVLRDIERVLERIRHALAHAVAARAKSGIAAS